jgi:hypothetical protein
MLIYRLAAIGFSLLLMSAHALSQQPAQPQFKSSELQVTVNRAKRNAAGQLVTSLVIMNVSSENVALYGSGGAAIMTDTGETSESSDASGLPICTTSCQIPHAAIGVYVDPVIVERDNSMMATFDFPGDAKNGSCSIDLTIRVYVARLGERMQLSSKDQWHQVAIGLPNVHVC